jgi:uncharacterized RDD family membrane protein YckC
MGTLLPHPLAQRNVVETQGPLAVIWVAAGLIAFYLALIWINSLLGLFLTPLFLIPLTWLQDRLKERKTRKANIRTEPRRTEPRRRQE